MRLPLLLLAAFAALGCTERAALDPAPAPRNERLALRLGNKSMGPHADTIGATMRQPLVAMVVDEEGIPVRGIPVSWEAFDGARVSERVVFTDAGGEAEVRLILGTRAGTHRARASVAGLTGSPIEFTASAHPGNAVSIAKERGDGLVVPPGDPVVHTVRVTDARGNGVRGIRVEWHAVDGGSLSWLVSFTGKSGEAEVRLTTARTGAVQHTVARTPDVVGTAVVTFTTFTTLSTRSTP